MIEARYQTMTETDIYQTVVEADRFQHMIEIDGYQTMIETIPNYDRNGRISNWW